MPRPLSVQLYSVRDQLAADRAGTLGRLAEMGYGAVEAFDVTADAKGLRRVLDDLGLTVSGAHVMPLLAGPPGPVLDGVAALGTPLAIVPAGFPHEDFTSYERLGRVADRLNSLARDAERHGLRLGYHNHWWEIEPRIASHGGRHAIEVLAELLDPAVFLEIDTYWAAVGGADVPALLDRLGPRVEAVHLKDGPGTKDDPNVAVGGGTMPVPEILAAAPTAWRVVEFDACAGDLLGELAASRTYVSALETA
ncbi:MULTISPECIES: sugar phosphate isomerase/epimerase family protein [Streptomyces]|uniref:Xylose isomerase n=1 Tax=Streptomyces lasiicapitis TaxID=1923961 RepID=A0ABQ2LPE2_9ACTN|nr:MULTISPECIES: sugar phosphate isomerase/epimerase [Streptomyces]QIB47399.1 sugar phosphate isomerase/epimerase [Streptomyces aureoverticillatus]GGO41385.1 xylose isomerase [Streptomyces lasiicapitis]